MSPCRFVAFLPEGAHFSFRLCFLFLSSRVFDFLAFPTAPLFQFWVVRTVYLSSLGPHDGSAFALPCVCLRLGSALARGVLFSPRSRVKIVLRLFFFDFGSLRRPLLLRIWVARTVLSICLPSLLACSIICRALLDHRCVVRARMRKTSAGQAGCGTSRTFALDGKVVQTTGLRHASE